MTAAQFPTWTHGRVGTYNHGCRCWECIVANSAYHTDLVARRSERLAADPTLRPHGNTTTYAAWGCRCEPCRQANMAHAKAWRAKRRAS